MSKALEIYTYGGGEALSSLFNGIVGIVGSDNYSTLIKLAGTVGLTWVLLVIAFKPDNFQQLTKWFVGFVLIVNALFVPKETILVKDYLNPALQQNIIKNVPWGLAYFAHMASSIGDGVTRLLEKNFFKQDDLKYQKYGTVMASTLVSRASQFRITNPDMASNIREFMQQCVFYDLLLGKYQIKDLFEADNLWNFVTSNASPARSFRYDNTIQTCKAGASSLNKAWVQEIEAAKSIYGKRFFPNQRDAKAALVSALPLSYGYLTNISEDAGELIKQNMMMNSIHDGLIANGAVTDSSAAIQGFAVSRAEQQQKTAYAITGQLAGRWLPIMKNVFEALFYGAFPFIFLIIMLPSGLMVLKTYLMSLFWIQSWAPLYAILNLLMHIDAKSSSLAAASLGSSTALNLATASGIEQVNADTAILAGYLSMAIPFIAFGIVKGGAHTFTHLAGYIGGVSQASATQASEEATTGNISLANTSMGNHNFNNMSAHKQDSNADIKTGLTTMQTASGSTIATTASGLQSISSNHAISSTGFQLNASESMRASAIQQSEKYTQLAQTSAQESVTSTSNAYRDMYELAKHQSHHESSGEHFSTGESAVIAKDLNSFQQVVDRHAHDTGISSEQSAALIGSMAAQGGSPGFLKAILPASFTAQAKLDGMSQERATEVHNHAKELVEANNLTEKLENISKAVSDQSFNTGTEEGSRIVDNISTSLEKAETARESVGQNLQQAESFKRMSSISDEESKSINANITQSFINKLKDMPNQDGTGTIGMENADHILHHQPELAMQYGRQFIEEETQAFMQQQMNHMGITENQLINKWNTQSLENNLEQNHQAQIEQINQTIEKQNISYSVDDSIKTDAEQSLNNTNQQMQNKEQAFKDSANKEGQEIKEGLENRDKPLIGGAIKGAGDRVGKTAKWAAGFFSD